MSRNCKICDSPNATNLHFGAHACKACAAFFRRTVKGNLAYECSSTNSCEIYHAFRQNCRQCRLTKCFRAGMKEEMVQGFKKSPENQNHKRTLDEQQPTTSNYYDSDPPAPYWDDSPPTKILRDEVEIMEMHELQEYIQIPNHVDNTVLLVPISPPLDPRIDEDERLYGLATLYMEKFVSLNMRRRLTYANVSLAAMFDVPCVCPFEKSDLLPFDHRSYRFKNRNDYTMILDYVNQFPDFHMLNKSEKTVLFQTAAAVDALADPAYYSQVIFPNESFFVTREAKFVSMDPLPSLELDTSTGDYSKEDVTMYKTKFMRHVSGNLFYRSMISMIRRQWKNVNVPLGQLKMSISEFSLFKALTIWHYNYYKLQDSGKAISARQRDDIFRTLLLICTDEGHEDPTLRVSEIVLAVGNVMTEVHELVTTLLEITVFDEVQDPILKDMLKFKY
ncbi:hypothetical protein B9Z55_018414 [Caenorhabditis nigoni]|uniref:Nuclear receptor domain-containing protein n=3 Tax=Caenorhabditis nigoni TaxID=1611254 RepID=A0A2G5TE36_9PELO|nr:hypothetical protein B9Z55_018414 [Caenorhabditis nigoni]